MRKAYISCPITVQQSRLDEVAADLRSRGFEVMFWVRQAPYGSREENFIEDCDLFIFMLPDNKFVMNEDDMDDNCPGVIKELDRYNDENCNDRSSSYLAYFSQEGLRYYDYRYNGGVAGEQGSFNRFFGRFPIMKPGRLRFKTKEEFMQEYRDDKYAQGLDDDDFDVEDWAEYWDWNENFNHLLGTVYPYENYNSSYDEYDDDESLYILESFLVEVKPGDIHVKPGIYSSVQLSGSTNRRLLLKKKRR